MSQLSPSFLLLLLCLGAVTSSFAADNQTAQSFSGEVTLKVGYRYLLSLPDGYEANTERKWPLVVFLHGIGERGTDIELIKKHGPPKLLSAGQKFEAVIASLQCETNDVWNPHGVKAVTDHLVQTLRIDPDRVYLTGLSMGGYGTWDTAFAYPNMYAAIAPICGSAGIRERLAERIKHVPCWIFHGDADPTVSVEYSKKIHTALKKAGSNAKLTLYPGVAHDSWTQTYENPEFWTWLLQQKRGAK